MTDMGFKRFERKIAGDFGTTRTGPLGTGMPDAVTDEFGIECKYLSKLRLNRRYITQAKTNATKLKLDWLLVVRGRESGETVAVLDYNTFLRLHRKAHENG